MTEFPRVAVGILAREGGEGTWDSLESVLAQTYGNLDIVFVDGSGDPFLGERIKGYQARDGRIRYLSRPGMTAPRLLHDSWETVTEGAGYVQWLPSGDVLLPEKIAYMMQVFLQYPEKHTALVAAHVLDGAAEWGYLECTSPKSYEGREFCASMLMGEENPGITLSNALLDAKCLRKAMGDMDWRGGVSVRTLWMALLFHGNLAYIPQALTRIREWEAEPEGAVEEALQWADLIDLARERGRIFSEAYESRKALAAWMEYAAPICAEAMRQNLHTREIGLLQRRLGSFASRLVYASEGRRCACCGRELEYYLPLPSHYDEMYQRYGGQWGRREMENRHELICSHCGSSDRYRAYAIWMKGEMEPHRKYRILDFAPEKCMTEFIRKNFPEADYRTADLEMEGVDYRLDIMDMKEIPSGSIDFFLCSHILEHVRDDRRAMAELYRILAPGGRGICVVPMDLDQKETDEDPGCTDPGEQWRRFGMATHVRKYSREDYIGRLRRAGFLVSLFGREYFGAERMRENGLEDTATVYVVSKPFEQ